MFRIVAAQFIATLAVAGATWMIGGSRAALSSLLGGLACTVPNGLFALNLARVGLLAGARGSGADGAGSRGSSASYALALLAGEFFKVALTVALLMLIAWAYRDVVWLAVIVSIIAVLMMQATALLWR